MTKKNILLAVADPQVLIDTTQSLGAGWEATSVATEADALAQFEKRSFDALLVDFNLGSTDASELLNQTLEKHPETTRFLFAYEADLALVAAKVNGTPNILPKPVEPAFLRTRIESGVKESKSKESETQPANSPSETAKVPAIYGEVLKALEASDVTHDKIGEIIGQDAGLASELFRINNHSYFGLPKNITRPAEAVEELGLDTVKGIVMALQFLAEHKRLNPGYLSLEQIWQHSINVGQIARDLVFLETKDRALASQALLAGLLHDMGKVVLAKNFEDLYGRVHSLSRKQPVALWDTEKEMFGANHGEIGGCLVGMWNLPLAVVEAAAFHHEPPLGEQPQLTPLAAVHIANVLERELGPSEDQMMVAPILYTPFLNQLGLLHRLPVWRAALGNRKATNGEAEIESAKTEPVAPAVSTSRARWRNTARTWVPPMDRLRGAWVWAGAAAVVLLLVLSFRTQREINQIKMAYARTPASQQAPAAASPAPETTAAPAPQAAAAAPQITPAASVAAPPAQAAPVVAAAPQPVTTIFGVAEEHPFPPLAPELWPKTGVSAATPEPVAASAPGAAVTNAQPNVAQPPKKPQPDFRLQGIIYTSMRPTAIVNGQAVRSGDHVDGATVVAVGKTGVMLEIKGQRRTLELK